MNDTILQALHTEHGGQLITDQNGTHLALKTNNHYIPHNNGPILITPTPILTSPTTDEISNLKAIRATLTNPKLITMITEFRKRTKRPPPTLTYIELNNPNSLNTITKLITNNS